MLSMLALPLWYKVDGLTHQELTLTAFGFSAANMPKPAASGAVWAIAVLAMASAALAAYEIFQFNTRLKQLKLGAANILLIIATFGVLVR